MSSAAIVYTTRYGSTRIVAEAVRSGLNECGFGQVELVLAADADSERLESADLVVIGGPIYAGRILGDTSKFCETHRELLLQRPVGLFITCLYDGEQATTQLVDAFPSWLHGHACARADLGGMVDLKQLKFIDRFLMKKIAKVHEDVDRIRKPAIRAFASTLAGCLGTERTAEISR